VKSRKKQLQRGLLAEGSRAFGQQQIVKVEKSKRGIKK
jgi:hypothetical protein